MLSDSEILELEKLLQEQKIDLLNRGLFEFNEETNPNYKFLYDAIKNQEYNSTHELVNGYRGCVLEGSSRSGKTWSGIDIIIFICTILETNCTINIYRETYNEFKTTLYDDFKRRLDDFGLDNPFHNAKDVKSFKIGRNTIYFLGDGKHGGGCDYAFYNEAMFIDHGVFDQSEMRCRKFWWMDYNPSFTDHWVFDNVISRDDVGFLRTTFLDNPFISPQEKNKILSYEPWESNTYQVTDDGVFYNGLPVNDKNQPPANTRNINNGTADEFMWKVYGLGLRGAMKGVIYPYMEFVDEFPKLDYIYGNDFGFTNDPNALVKYTEDKDNIWFELLVYEPIDNPIDLATTFKAFNVLPHKPMVCDSSDRYSNDKGSVEMVRGLKDNGYPEAFKVSKTQDMMFWIGSVKQKKLHCVRDKAGLWRHVKKERENYVFKEINGKSINKPIDGYDHALTAMRYGHMAWNKKKYEIIW